MKRYTVRDNAGVKSSFNASGFVCRNGVATFSDDEEIVAMLDRPTSIILWNEPTQKAGNTKSDIDILEAALRVVSYARCPVEIERDFASYVEAQK